MTVEEIVRMMSEEGLRITEQRKTMARLFVEKEGYMTPVEVYEKMGGEYPGLSFDTVYRNLRLLHELGILEQFVFEDGVKFKVNCGEAHHHHHLICLECEKTTPITFCPMPYVQEAQEFQIIKHKFEVFGYCKACKQDVSEKVMHP